MKIYSWNVNGIRAVLKKGMFLPFMKRHAPDILCLQETKAERGQIEIELPGYHEYWNSAVKKGYSGTAIFSQAGAAQGRSMASRKRFASTIRFADELERDSADEGRVITAEFESLYVVTVYTPNAKDDLSRLALRFKHWDPAFLAYCQQLEKTKPVIFCGDLNVAHTELDLANPKQQSGQEGFHRRGAQGLPELRRCRLHRYLPPVHAGQRALHMVESFCELARRATLDGESTTASSRKRCERAVKSAEIHADVMGSDHCPVSVTLGA